MKKIPHSMELKILKAAGARRFSTTRGRFFAVMDNHPFHPVAELGCTTHDVRRLRIKRGTRIRLGEFYGTAWKVASDGSGSSVVKVRRSGCLF